MNYQIKRLLNGIETVIKTVRPNGTQTKKAMGESVVDMSFTLPVYVEFKINDFVQVYGETYRINVMPSVKKVASRKYEYNIQFEAVFYDLAKVQLQFLNAQNQLLEPVFNLMGNAATIVGLIVENANRHSAGWTVGVVDDTPYQNFSFNAENCLQVLNRLASDFETEFWIDNKTIHLQKRQVVSGLNFEYGQGKGLYSIARSNKSNINILTRLYVRGGSRNLPLDYRNYATSLLLPNGDTYIQDDAKVSPHTGFGLIEATQVFESIFPYREGTITTVVSGDGNWDKFSDASLDFNINSYTLATPAKVLFNTGQLAGYEFELSSYNHTFKQFTIKQNNDEALKLPTNLIRPAVGDKYVLLDIRMPQTYVDAAEAKLLAAAQDYYDKNSDPSQNFAYSINCDPIWFAGQNINVVLGNTVNIYDADLGIDGAIRIAGYKRDLQVASKYELEISDSIGASEIARNYAQQAKFYQAITLTDKTAASAKGITDNFGMIDGGLFIANTIKIGSKDADMAGITGVGETNEAVRFWAGTSYSNRNNAPFSVNQAGKLKATEAEIAGKIIAGVGSIIGGVEIGTDGKFNLSGTKVQIKPDEGLAVQGYFRMPVVADPAPEPGSSWMEDVDFEPGPDPEPPVGVTRFEDCLDVNFSGLANRHVPLYNSALAKWTNHSTATWDKVDSGATLNNNIAGSASRWNNQTYAGYDGPPNLYMMGYRADATWGPVNASYLQTFLNINNGSLLSNNVTGYSQRLEVYSNQTWLGSNTPQWYPMGLTVAFVGDGMGFPTYGSVINLRGYSGGGGSLQMYVPYGSSIGGTNLRARFGDYTAGGDVWTGWKTLMNAGDPLHGPHGGVIEQQSTDAWNLYMGNNGSGGLTLRANNGTVRGSVYTDGSSFGLVNSSGSWSVKAWGGGGELYGSWSSTGSLSGVGVYDNGSRVLSARGLSYYQVDTWLQFTSSGYGLYFPTSGAGTHFNPNGASTYGTWQTQGSKNGYSGIHDIYSNVVYGMYDGAGNGGAYNNSTGWHFYWAESHKCMGVGTSTTFARYGMYVAKGLKVDGVFTMPLTAPASPQPGDNWMEDI